MLIEEFENFEINFKLFKDILIAIGKNIYKYKDIEKFCNKIKYDNTKNFRKYIEILKKTGYIKIDEKKNVKYANDLSCKKISEIPKMIIRSLYNLEELQSFINSQDIIKIDNEYLVNNAYIPLKYSGLRNFLLENSILSLNKIENDLLIINKKYVNYFIDSKMTLKQLNKILEKEKAQGMIAEKFVLEFEKKRLGCKFELIKQISQDNTIAGYDIESFDNKNDLSKIYIEVKSYSKEEQIFLTKNEMDKAAILKERYYIYIVNINNINKQGYVPKIIQNPMKNLINSEEYIVETQLVCIKRKSKSY